MSIKNFRQKSATVPEQADGFSMLEVMVALLVLSIGLLGLAMLQVRGMQLNSDAYFRTQATVLAYDLMDRMRANRKGALEDRYRASTPPTGTAPNCDSTSCSYTDLATYDLIRWYTALGQTLPVNPNASTTITSAGGLYTITINWMERDLPLTQTWVFEPHAYK